MELTDIIVYSLKIFCLTISFTITVSYIIYKIKDRKRIKPYSSDLKIERPSSIKITYQKHNTDLDQFEIYKSLNKVPVKILSKDKNVFINNTQKIIRYLPEKEDQYLLNKTVKENFNILDHYSVDAKEEMYKVKI